MRKKTRAWRYCRFASKYWRIAGVRFVPAGTEKGAELEGWDTAAFENRTRSSIRWRSDPSPVLILSLDTTTRAGSAAVLRDGDVLAVLDGDASRTHGERLPGELDRVLQVAGVSLHDLDLLAVASGPGAFTGLRIGLAAMQGVAMATGRPVIGVSALEALALSAFERLQVPSARVGSWMDAARGEVFAALHDVDRTAGAADAADVPARVIALTEPVVGTPDWVWSSWSALRVPRMALTGDGAVRYADTPGAGADVMPPLPLAPAIGRLALWRARGGGAHPPHQLQPLYVRRPDAERR